MDGVTDLGDKIVSHPQAITILSIMIVGLLAASVLVVAYALGRWVAGGQNNFTKVLNQNHMLTGKLDTTLTTLNSSVEFLPRAFESAAKTLGQVFADKLAEITQTEIKRMESLANGLQEGSTAHYNSIMLALKNIDLRLSALDKVQSSSDAMTNDLKSINLQLEEIKSMLSKMATSQPINDLVKESNNVQSLEQIPPSGDSQNPV